MDVWDIATGRIVEHFSAVGASQIEELAWAGRGPALLSEAEADRGYSVAGGEGRGGDRSEVCIGIGAARVIQGQPHVGVLRIEVVQRVERLEPEL